MKVKKKKKEFGYFYTLSPGDPEKNMEVFNKNMATGDAPEGTPSGSVAEDLNEAQKKNEYEITYITRSDDKTNKGWVKAYSEKQAALVFRKANKDVYRIVDIKCIEDHSKDDGEQLSLFEASLLEMPIESDHRLTLISIIHLVAEINKDFAEKYSYLIDLADNKENVIIHHAKGGYSDNKKKTHKIPNDQTIQNAALIRTGLSHPQTLDINNLSPKDGISFLRLLQYLAEAKEALDKYTKEL